MRSSPSIGVLEERRIPWLEILEVLFRRRRVLLSVALGGILLAVFVAWLQPHLYRSNAKIQLTNQALSGPRVGAMTDQLILAELDLLKSPALLRTMYGRQPELTQSEGPQASLRTRVRTLLATPKRLLEGLSAVAPIDRFIQQHAERIDVERVVDTNVVEVAFTDLDPEYAAGFVNDLLVHHLDRVASLGEGTSARSFYEEQADLLAERWREANGELSAFRRRHGTTISEKEIHQVISRLESQRIATETQALELAATIAFLSSEIDSVPITVAGESLERRDESVGLLKSRLFQLQIERIELLSTYTEESKVVSDLDRQIEQLGDLLTSNEGQIVSETTTAPNPNHQAMEAQLLQSETKLNAANARLTALDTQIASYTNRLGRMEGVMAELSRLEGAVQSARDDHRTYMKQTERARLESALDAAGSVNVTIIERAEVPLSPLPSNRKWILLLGALASLVVGIASALSVDFLNPTVKSGLQLERLTGLPVVAQLRLEGD